MSSYVYRQTETGAETGDGCGLFTVGFYRPDGKWEPESDHGGPDGAQKAAERTAWLNGSGAVKGALDEALNSGDGTYRP